MSPEMPWIIAGGGVLLTLFGFFMVIRQGMALVAWTCLTILGLGAVMWGLKGLGLDPTGAMAKVDGATLVKTLPKETVDELVDVLCAGRKTPSIKLKAKVDEDRPRQ